MDGRIRKVEDFLKTRLLDTLTEQLTKVTTVPDYICITLKSYCKCKWNRFTLKNWKNQQPFQSRVPCGACWNRFIIMSDCRLWTTTLLVKRCGWVDWGQPGRGEWAISQTHLLLDFCKHRDTFLKMVLIYTLIILSKISCICSLPERIHTTVIASYWYICNRL